MISFTDTARNKIQKLVTAKNYAGIRLGVKTTGCSGLAYVLEYVDTPRDEDQCFDVKQCQIYVDPRSAVYLEGMTIDYVRQGLNEGFEFVNPNERDRCGCGESFRV